MMKRSMMSATAMMDAARRKYMGHPAAWIMENNRDLRAKKPRSL
jgi:hypothetical protein